MKDIEPTGFGLDVPIGKDMAKYRHRIFEMYEFRDEATRALTPKSARPVPEAPTPEAPAPEAPAPEAPVREAPAPESWAFKHLAVSRLASVTHVEFKRAQIFGEETVSDLRRDFTQLADRLARDSKVLLDFAGVMTFSSASIDELALFNRKLKTKGSRFALCCLDPAVHQSFF